MRDRARLGRHQSRDRAFECRTIDVDHPGSRAVAEDGGQHDGGQVVLARVGQREVRGRRHRIRGDESEPVRGRRPPAGDRGDEPFAGVIDLVQGRPLLHAPTVPGHRLRAGNVSQPSIDSTPCRRPGPSTSRRRSTTSATCRTSATRYTEVAADVLARWHRQAGDDTWLLTGTDEHGQKILRTAIANGVDAAASGPTSSSTRRGSRCSRRSTSRTTTSSARPSERHEKARRRSSCRSSTTTATSTRASTRATTASAARSTSSSTTSIDRRHGDFAGQKVCAIHSQPGRAPARRRTTSSA